MATAQAPLPVKQENNMLQTSPAIGHSDRQAMNLTLIVMLIVLAAYPFVVQFLPEPVRQYLGSLLR